MTQAPQTAPSIASVFTGVPPHVHGLQFDATNQVFVTGIERTHSPQLSGAYATLAERFKAAGYATCGISSNAWIGAEWGFVRGFDRFVGWKQVDPELPNDGRRVLKHLSDWLGSAPSSSRFVYAHFMDTHAPYTKGHTRFVTTAGAETVFNGKRTVPDADLHYMMDLYDSNIVYADALLEELFARLEAGGRPWIAAVIGDHGDEFGEHGGLGHGTTLYGELLRVPALVTGSYPMARTGSSAYPLQLIDVHDMLLAAAGVADSPALGLVSTATPEPAPPDRARTSEFAGMAALRRGDWKYIVTAQPFSEELYEMRRDPGERVNLAAREPAVMGQFREEASALWPKMFRPSRRGSSPAGAAPR
jgi:arylsulfatase A-like enzyme